MSEPRCPLCENQDPRRLEVFAALGGPYDQLRCAACGLVFADPLEHPGKDWYEAAEAYLERNEGLADPGVPEPDRRHRLFFEHAGAPGKVLDLGCGDGGFLAMARARGWEPSGVDLDDRAVCLAREQRGLGDVHASEVFAALEARAGRFDAVTAYDFLEHVTDPRALARGMVACLKPGGALVVSVPNAERYPRVFDPLVDRPPHHLTLWTPGALRRLGEEAGLEEVRVHEPALEPHDLILQYVWRVHRARRFDFRKGPVYYLVNLGCRVLVAALRALGWARGHTLVLTGRRPGG